MILETLRSDGIVVLPTLFDADSMLRYLDQCKKWNNHVKQAGEEPKVDSSSTCWDMRDVILAPGWLEAALEWMSLAKEYLQAPPLLYSINAFTTYPRTGPTQADIQEFHRDTDDVRFVALFCYLTPVCCTEDGPHQFAKGTQDGLAPSQITAYELCSVTGEAGTTFLADTRGLHRGVRPTTGPRTMAWARFGVSDPPASYGWDKLSPIDSAKLGCRWDALTQEQRDCVRLVVR